MKTKINLDPDIAQILGEGKSSGRRRRLKRYSIVTILIIMGILAVLVWKNRSGPDSVQYETKDVKKEDLVVLITATGTLEPLNSVDVGSELSGSIENIYVDYNDKVTAGQVLAELDTSTIEAQVTQSKASLEVAKAEVLQAQATVKETRIILDQYHQVWERSQGKVPSQIELDGAEADFDRAQADEASAQASVVRAEATLAENETDLSKAIIKSPINGVVLSREVEVGQTVAASYETPVLFTLAEDLTEMEVHVDIDEADIGQVEEGQEATFYVAAYPNRTYAAQITQLRYDSSTTSGVVTYETVMKVDNPDLSLRPGMTATSDITVKKVKDAILVPTSALRFVPSLPGPDVKPPSNGLIGSLIPHPPDRQEKQPEEIISNNEEQQVWTLREGRLIPIPITIGSTSGSWTEVISGDVKPGLAVVVDTITSERER